MQCSMQYHIIKLDIVMLSRCHLYSVSNVLSPLAPPVTVYITFKTGVRPVLTKLVYANNSQNLSWLTFARHCPFSFAYLAARIFLNGQIGKQQGCLDTSWNIVSSSQISWKTWMPHLSLLILWLSAIQAFLYWYVKNRISQLELLVMLSQHHYFIIILWHYFALLDVSWVSKVSPMVAILNLINKPF